MAATRGSTSGIQVKHILIALISTLTTILFITSIVLITIGYLNPFGSVGLGILAGGCVVFFSAVLFLCASSIWIKNKYYPDETDYKEKLVVRSSEDITLLKPASNVFSSDHAEGDCGKNHNQGDNNNPVPLYSVSTVYSSHSSSSNIPEDLMPYNWQEEDIAGVLDSDVFSSSLTALQHGDMKTQQRLHPAKVSTDVLSSAYTGQNEHRVKGKQKMQHENIATHSNVSDLPRQRRPVIMDSPYVPHGNCDKQVEIPINTVQSTVTKETHSGTNKDFGDGNTQLCPVDTSKTKAVTFQHKDCKSNSHNEKDQVSDEKTRNNIKQNIQTADRQESSITEGDNSVHNTKRTNKQGIIRKNVITMLAGNLEEKRNSNEQTNKFNQNRTTRPLPGLSPQSKPDQSRSSQGESSHHKEAR